MGGNGGIFDLGWMAWTWPTALFFIFVFGAIGAMGVWEYISPGGSPRHGVLGLDTTRGDRLFITLLGSAFIFLLWLGLYGVPLWGGLAISLAWGFFIFRYA
jgi:predicted small integral membrane protein